MDKKSSYFRVPFLMRNREAEILSIKQQRDVLATRAKILSRFRTKEDHDKTNSEAFEDLKNLSSEKLAPVLFYSVQHGWMAGFLIQKVGRGGHRVLVKLEDWKILRTKKSAIIKKVPYGENFNAVVTGQETAQTLLMNMVAEHVKQK